ncbi:hypothetical protein [Flagellimonas olearia]|nr:hypothetical protein [Allomuricauda olearia]
MENCINYNCCAETQLSVGVSRTIVKRIQKWLTSIRVEGAENMSKIK